MRLPTIVPVLLALAACAGNGGRQPLPPATAPLPLPPEPAPDPLAAYPELLLLPGRPVDVRYVPDSLDRATRLQARLDVVCEPLMKLTRDPFLLRGVVLDRAAWEKAGLDVPWGLPARTAATVFAAPAEGDAATVARARALTGGWLPALGGEPLRGTAEEAASLAVADAILQHAIAAAFVEHVRVRGAEPWITGLLTQLVARLTWEATDGGRMHEIAYLFDRIAEAQGGARARRLADYRPGLPLETELWYQAQLLRGADVLWVELGQLGATRWLRERIRANQPLTGRDLERKFPELAAWQQESFAGATAAAGGVPAAAAFP